MGIDYSLSKIYYNGDAEPQTTTTDKPNSRKKKNETSDMMPDLTE
jgi:hypothetical protein